MGESEKTWSQRTPFFKVNASWLDHVQDLGIYCRSSRANPWQRMSVTKCVDYFCWKGLPGGKTMRHVEYMSTRDGGRLYPKFWRVLCNVLLVSVARAVYSSELTEHNCQGMVRAEHKILALMMDLVQKFSNLKIWYWTDF